MKITIYSTSICAGCETLTNWLVKNNISFDKRITDTDQAIMEEFMNVNDGMISVPFTIIEKDNGEIVKISGVDYKKFKQELAI